MPFATPDHIKQSLHGLRILIVEDDYMIAASFAFALEGLGAHVLGPMNSVRTAIGLIQAEAALDGAFLDINLGREDVFPVADLLALKAIPFVFVTGYDGSVVPLAHRNAEICEKPVSVPTVTRALLRSIAERARIKPPNALA